MPRPYPPRTTSFGAFIHLANLRYRPRRKHIEYEQNAYGEEINDDKPWLSVGFL
jgi:hypothetical protein